MDDGFDRIMASLDPAMVVVTVAGDGERDGCLMGFHSQSGIDPRRYCLWFSKANRTHAILQRCDVVGIHFLTRDDLDLAELFGGETGDDVDKFAGYETEPGSGGVPLLSRCPNRIVARRIALLDDGSDHVCVTTEPIDAVCDRPFHPLRLSELGPLEPGHLAGEPPHGQVSA